MKTFPHKPVESALAERFPVEQEKFQEAAAAAAAAPKNAEAFHRASDHAFHLAGLAYAFEQPSEEVRRHAVQAAWHGARAVDIEEQIGAARFERYLALAIWTGDRVLRGMLGGWSRTNYAQPENKVDDVVLDACDALAALAKGRGDNAASIAQRGQVRLTRGLVPTATLNVMAPVLRIEEALGKADLMTLRIAVGERNNQHTRAAAWEANRNSPHVLIDVLGLALVKLGAEAGLSVESKSVYLPTGLFG